MHKISPRQLRHPSAGAAATLLSLLLWLTACSPVRHVPRGSYLLDKVRVSVADVPDGEPLPFTTSDRERYSEAEREASDILRPEVLETYLRQLPNHKLLWKVKMQLGIYNMSGHDTTRWYNRLARSLGEAPVIFDTVLTRQSAQQLTRALVNRGYLHARVAADTLMRPSKRKATVEYRVVPGPIWRVGSIDFNIPDTTLRHVVTADSAFWPVTAGSPLNRDALEAQRVMIAERLRSAGYYAFQKNFITFTADTTGGSTEVALTMNVIPPPGGAGREETEYVSTQWRVRKVTFVTDYEPARMGATGRPNTAACDTLRWRGYDIIYDKNLYLRPSVLLENCFIRPGRLWRARNVDNTYDALSRLGILKFVNIRSIPVPPLPSDTAPQIDVYVLLTPGKSQTIALQLEGTNSEGDLGVAASVSYTHRNIGHGSETFSIKGRGAYESLSGNLQGFIHDRYMELSVDAGLSFPKFKLPLLPERFKRRIKATTEVNMALSYQERPEYTRVIANAGWAYKWVERRRRTSHIFTPLDIEYVYLPKSTLNFIDNIAPNNPLLRYSYEDHFIMRLGYSFYHTNKRPEAPSPYLSQRPRNIFTIRAKGETAGNLLFALSSIFSHRDDFHSDPYRVFGIHYAQYLKLEGDYGLTRIFDRRNSLAFHAGLGVAIPYGNSAVIPFEKRFYGGGANGVRGWSVRTLGPGSYAGTNSVANFMNQCGDIRLDLSLEYRAKLFWLIELGVFVDAGNIWTIRNYENQPGGFFRFDTFYKQIAAAYGLGIRMDFTYFLLRFDLGMKAHNPAMGAEPWPLLHPRWGRDRSFHFSVGYPF